VDRIEQATTLAVGRVHHQWAGLRSFVADRSPVVGYEPSRPGFFWHAALGGYGIQTAPALSRLAAALALNRGVDSSLVEFGIDAGELSPARLRTIAA
jgi:D-arginine dehydrogenase